MPLQAFSISTLLSLYVRIYAKIKIKYLPAGRQILAQKNFLGETATSALQWKPWKYIAGTCRIKAIYLVCKIERKPVTLCNFCTYLIIHILS
jgi:hypothetical protein